MNDQAKRLLSLLDFTRLNDMDSPDAMEAFCQRAITPLGNVAAVCVYPEFVPLAVHLLQSSGIRIATVANFPGGDQPLEQVLETVDEVLKAGADEIDLVLRYRDLLAGNEQSSALLISACKGLCAERRPALLKVILETGILEHAELIEKASHLAIKAGADFLKTSTGKVPVNATLKAASIMMKVSQSMGGIVGFKAAGGIKTIAEAQAYIALAEEIFGADWVNPSHFRIGASALLDNLIRK